MTLKDTSTFYVAPSYIPELEIHRSHQVTLMPLADKPDDAIDSWIGNLLLEKRTGTSIFSYAKNRYDEVYGEWFKILSKKIGVKNHFKWPITHPKLKPGPMVYDWLIINSKPLSGQWQDYDEQQMDDWIRTLPGYKITTKRMEGIECTNTNLLEIGNISIRAKGIVAINTSPIICCLNQWNINKPFYVLSDLTGYSFTNNVSKLSQIKIGSN